MFVNAPPSWDEIANTKEFQSLTPNEKANVQRRWVFDRMNYDYDRGNEIDQKAMVKEFKKNSFEPTVINTGFKDFTDYRSYMEGQQAEGLQGKAREEALSPQYSFGEGLLVSNEQRMGALGVGLVRPFEGMAGLADMTVGKALEAVTGSRMGIDKLADNLHGIVADMGRGVEMDVIHGFSEGGLGGGVSALVNMVLTEVPNQIIQLGIGAAGIPQPYALAMLGASSMGSKYNDLKNDQSLSELQKYSIATLNGAIEGVTELMDSIPFIKRMTSSTKQAIFREALRSKPFRTIGKEFLKTFGGEAAEEATGELLQNISEAVIRGEKIDWKELGVQVANAGIGGGAMGGMMGVGGVAYNRHADNKRTSRKAFQEMKAMQAGFDPASKEFSRIAKIADLPEKYSTREGRRKAIDDYDFHGEPIVFGEATEEDRKAALKERIAWYEKIRDHIEDGDEKAEWEEYYKEWKDKLSALENKQEEPLPKPVDEEGNELGAEEVTTEETPVEQPEPPKEETPAVVEKPTEEKPTEEKPTEEQPSEEKPLTTAEQITKAFNGLAAGVKRGVLLKLAQYVNEGRYDDASDWASKYVPADKLSGFMDEISKAGLSTMSEDEQAAKVDELINKYSPQETPSPTAEVKELAKTPKDRLNLFLETVSTEGERNRSFVSNNLSEIIEGDTGTKPLYEYIEDDLKNGYVPYEYGGNYYFKKNDGDSFSVSEDMFNYAKWLIEHKDEWGGVPATEEKQPTSKKRKKRSAIDAYLEDGSFDDDADMPTVEGERRVSDTPKKAAKRNPMLRGSVENETRTDETDVEDSFVEQISKAAKAVADGLGFKVVVHRNDADLPAEVQEDLAAFGEGTHAEAWVGSDGVVHLVASRLESSEAAVRKLLHEIVGHNGLAALFKGRNSDAWNDMVENLWEGHRADILERCKDYLNVFDVDTQAGRSELVEEWLARLAETSRKPMWWKTIVSKVRALLRACGVEVAYSDADIQQLLADAATAARRAQNANMEDANIRFSLVTDKKIEQEFNEDGKYITTYRSAMLGDDGKLYPPMATKGGEGMEIGKVYRSDEHPELRGKDGKFPLKSDMRDSKASGTVPAAYNPYFHSQAGMLNDQFAVAYDKSKMVTVKCRVLKSDIESGYQAEGAKDPVGYAEWATSGPVTRQMRKRGGRTVILSRYIMPVDIVEQKEVAKWIKDFIGDEDVTIPWNVVNQSLRDELEKIGVKVGSEAEFREAERIKNEKKKQRKVTGKTGNRYSVGNAQQEYNDVVNRYKGTPQWMKAPNGNPTNLTERQWVQVRTPSFKKWFGDWENDTANASKVVDENGEPKVVYHGTEKHFWAFDNERFGSHTDIDWNGVGVWGKGHYFSSNFDEAKGYTRGNQNGRIMFCYLNIRNPMGGKELLAIGREAERLTEENPENFWKEYQRLIDESVNKNKYDGSLIEHKSSNEYVVFTPNQVKSATDNVGTFSNERGDIRFSATKPVQDETSPIPQGPRPPIANIMRQRTARSPISNLRALRLPAIVMLGRKLGGSLSAVDRIKRMPSALGVFRHGTREIEVIRSLVEPHQLGDQWVVPQGKEDQKAEMIKDYWAERGIPRDEIEIVMKTDEAAKEVTIKAIWHDKSQTLLKKVLGHEIGHLIDYNAGETTTHGNVLGTVGGMGYKYLRKIIGETPDNQIDFEKFEKRKKELHKQAEGLAGKKPKDADELKAWRETVKAEYANLLTSECEKNGWFQAAVIREELIANTEWWSGKIGSDPNYRRYRTRPTELFAEAMSVLLNAPEKFAEQMPETWRMLQNYQKERPEFHKAWQGLMRMMNNEEAYNEALDKLADAGYTADENTYREIVKNNNNLWLDFCSLFHRFSYIEDAAMRLVKSGEVKFDDTPLAPIVAKTHMTEQTLYLAKAQRFVAPLNKVGIDNHTIGKFLEWKRIVNDPKINKGHIINPNGMTVYDAEDALNGLHKKLGDEKWQMLEDWHKKLWQLRQEFVIDLAEKSGAYTKELITQMRENEWYSYRAVIEKIYDDNGKEKASSGLGQIYSLKGTLDPIANPLGWTYEHDIMLMRGIRENMARRATVEFMKRYFPELIERVNKFSSWNKSNPPVGWSNLVVLENGKPVTYRIVKNWVSGFEPNMLINGPVGRVIYHPVIQFPLNLFRRAWTTFAATFMMGNPVRDYGSSVLHLGGIAPNVGIWEFTKQWAKGMKESFGFEFMDDFKTAKKIMESAFGIRFRDNIDDFPLMEEALRRNILQPERGYDRVNKLGGEVGDKSEELFRRYGIIESRNPKWDKWEKIDRLGLVYKYAHFIEKITTSFERGAKLGGLLALKNAGMSEGEVNYNVSKNIGSPDYQDRGILTPIVNTVFIFSNASIQGMSSLWYSIKANPKALAVRFMTTVGTAVTIQWLLESGVLRNALLSMYGGDKDKAEENILYRMLDWMQKMYGKITHYNRYHFLCMPIPFTEQEDGSVFMLRIPYAENAKLPAMIMHAALDAAHTDIEKDKNLMNETVDALLGQELNLNPVIKGGMDVGTMLAGNNPYDYYRGRQAVKYSEWEAGGLRRFKGATSYLYNQYSPVSQLKYDTRDPYLAFNLFAQTSGIGAFIKPQKYGEVEQSRAVTAKKRRKKLNGKASTFYR